MGVCGSRPKVVEDLKLKKNKHRRRRRRILRRRVSSQKIEADAAHSHSVLQTSNRASDVAWFDSTSALDSECDDEFYSVYDGEVSASHGDEIGEDRRLTPDHCGMLQNTCLLEFWVTNVTFNCVRAII